MTIYDIELLPVAKAYEGFFRSSQAFIRAMKNDPTAPRVITITPRKRYVRKDEYERWIAAKLNIAA